MSRYLLKSVNLKLFHNRLRKFGYHGYAINPPPLRFELLEYHALSNVFVTIGALQIVRKGTSILHKNIKHEYHQPGDSVFLNIRIYKIKLQCCPLNKIIVM